MDPEENLKRMGATSLIDDSKDDIIYIDSSICTKPQDVTSTLLGELSDSEVPYGINENQLDESDQQTRPRNQLPWGFPFPPIDEEPMKGEVLIDELEISSLTLSSTQTENYSPMRQIFSNQSEISKASTRSSIAKSFWPRLKEVTTDITSSLFMKEPSRDAFKAYQANTFKKNNITIGDPRAADKMGISSSQLPPNAIKPAGPGPRPEDLIKKRGERKKFKESGLLNINTK